MNNRRRKAANGVLAQIAQKNGVTLEEVRTQIEEAIRTGMQSDDPEARAFWQGIAVDGNPPTPEDAIEKIVELLYANEMKQ